MANTNSRLMRYYPCEGFEPSQGYTIPLVAFRLGNGITCQRQCLSKPFSVFKKRSRLLLQSYCQANNKTEWSPLEPEVVAHKFYALGVGWVLEMHVEGDLEHVELVEIRNE